MTNAAQNYEVKAGLDRVEAFDVVGVSEVITNRDEASEQINALWERFFKESVGQSVSSKVDDIIYAVYSDYEGDYTQPYRLTIGYKIQKGEQRDALLLQDEQRDALLRDDTLHMVEVQEADYAMMSAAGEQPKALIETWTAVWQSDLDRLYKTDFEVYGQRFFEEGVNEVLVAIGVSLEE